MSCKIHTLACRAERGVLRCGVRMVRSQQYGTDRVRATTRILNTRVRCRTDGLRSAVGCKPHEAVLYPDSPTVPYEPILE